MVLQSRVRFTHIYFSDSLKMMSATKINVTSKRLKIAKLRLQILVDNSKSYSKHTYFFKRENDQVIMLQSRVKFKFKDSNRWTNEERPSVEELISIKNHESLTKGDQGFMYNLLCSFRIYNFHNNLITFRNEVFSLLLAWEIAWAVCNHFCNLMVLSIH